MNRDRLREEVRRLVTVDALIGATVVLVPSGRALRGACPSHPDAERALQVDRQARSYFCHACLRQGDVVRWMMESEGLSEDDALSALARRAGIAGDH